MFITVTCLYTDTVRALTIILLAMESVLSFSQLFLNVREPRSLGISILGESIIDFSAEMTRASKQH